MQTSRFVCKAKQVTRTTQARRFVFLLVLSLLLLPLVSYIYSPSNDHKAYAATSSTINFQARLLNSAGNVVPDGNYHIEFKIYDSLAAGSSAQGVCSLDSSSDDCWWRETRTTGNLVRVVNGYFTVNLGSVTSFGANIPWDQELWLTMNIGGTSGPSWDGEMSPRMKLTAVPYALTAGKLQANSSGITNQLVFATPSGSNKTITLPNETGTVCTTGSICSGYQSSSTAIIQVPGSTAQNTITPTANSVVGLTVNGTSGTAATAVNILQGGAAVALNVTSSNTGNGQTINLTNTSGTQVAGLMIERNGGGGTTTSLLNLTNTAGTVTNGILLSGTVATAIDLSGATSTTDLILDDGLTIAQTSDLDLDLVEGGLTLNVDFGETTGSTITQSTASAFELESSSNTAAALKLEATAGGIDIFASAASAGEDIDIIATGSSINITSTEGAADGIVITSTGGGIDITTTGSAAGEDIDINAGGSSINLTSSEAVADAIVLQASNASGQILFNAGTTDRTADALVLDVDINSASVDGFYIDLDVGTALSAAEQVSGINIDVTGLAGDDATSLLNGINLNGDVTSAGTVRGLNLSGSFDTGLDLSGAATTTDLILDDGLTIAQTSDLDLDLVEGGLTLNVDFGETTGSAITQSASGAYVLGASSANLTLQTTTSGNVILQAAGTGTTATIQIGAGGAGSTTPDFFALDVKSDTGDPAGGFEGAMYYNTFDNKFRCYQGTGWVDCAGSGGSGITLQGAYDADVDGSDATITLSNEDDSIVISNPNDSANDTDSAFILKVEQLLATGSQETLLIESNGTGNLLRVRDTTATAADVLTIADGGATKFKSQTNSNIAFQLQNATQGDNGNLLLADTTNTNLVTNSSIESNTTGWAINTGSGSVARNTSIKLVSNASLAVSTSATTGAGAKFDTSTLLSASTTYTLSFWARTPSGNFPLEAGRSDSDAFGGETSCGVTDESGVYSSVWDTWSQFSCTFTTSGSVTTGGYIFIRQADATLRSPAFYLDGVMLQTGTIANPTYNEGKIHLNGVISSPLTIRPQEDTIQAFRIQAAGGENRFIVDTQSSRVGIGINYGQPSAVLDVHDITGQPGVNLLKISDNGGTEVLVLDDDGNAKFQNQVNASDAFQIQNAAGSSILNTDTTKSAITIQSTTLSYLGGADITGSANTGTGNSGTNSAVISGRYLYMVKAGDATACSQSVGSAIGCELQVYDNATPGTPKYIGGADVTGSTNSGTGNANLSNIAVSGKYLYVIKPGDATACSATAGSAIGCELQVYDISNPSAPAYRGGADVTGSTNSGTGTSNASAVSVAGSNLYVSHYNDATACSATAGSAIGCELQVYDISNPSAPAYRGGADVTGSTNSGTGNDEIFDIDSNGRYVIAIKDNDATACSQTAGSALGCEMQVYDMVNPSAPAYIGGADAGGATNSGTDSFEVYTVEINGRYAVTGKAGYSVSACSSTAGSAEGCELQVYDIANPATPTYVGGADISGTTNGGSTTKDIYTLKMTGKYVIVGSAGDATACSQAAGSAIGCELQLYDLSTPGSPSYIGGADVTGSTNSGTGNSGLGIADITGRYIYTRRSGDATACSQTAGSALGCELQVYDIGGLETNSALIHSLESGVLSVQQSASINNFLNVGGSLSVGQNANIGGNLSVAGSSITLNSSNTGEIDGWKTESDTLPAARQEHASVVANGYVYAIAGYNSTQQSAVYYAKLNTDGSTGAWQTNTNALPGGREDPTAVAANGYIYVIGGGNGASTSTVYYAKLNANGSTGVWQTGQSLPTAREDATSVVANGYIYVLAGSATTSIYYAKLNTDGSLGAWNTNSTVLAGARDEHSTATANGYIYVIGGNSALTTVYYAPMNSDGSIGSWNSTTALPSGREDQSTVVVNGYIYVIGGYNATQQSTVYYARLNSDGTVGSWQTSTNSLPAIRQDHTSVTANGYIYAIGGNDASSPVSTVYYTSTARVQIGGSLDLVGLQGQNLTDGGDFSQGSTGGQLTAGNTKIVGSLEVQGQARFAQSISVENSLVLNGSLSQGFNKAAYTGGGDAGGTANSGTAQASNRDIKVVGRYAYIVRDGVSATNCSSANGCELQIWDVSNPSTPVYMGGGDASGTSNTGTGATNFYSVNIVGRYAYIATDGNASATSCATATYCELQIWDISRPNSPVYVGGADSTGATNSGTGIVVFDSVYVSGNYAYTGSRNDTTTCSATAGSAIGCELKVWDVSNPAKPTYIAGGDASGNTNSGTAAVRFNQVFINGRYAYIGTQGDVTACSGTVGSAVGCEIQVWDISNPSYPSYKGGADTSGTTGGGTSVNQVRRLVASENFVYTGWNADAGTCSATAGSANGCEFKIFDVSNPASPTYKGGADTSGTTNGGSSSTSGMLGIDVAGRYAYIARDGGSGGACSPTAGSADYCDLHIYDVSNPTLPIYIGGGDATGTFNSGGTNSGNFSSIDVAGGYAYIGQYDLAAATNCSTDVTYCEFQIWKLDTLEASAITAHMLKSADLQVQQNANILNDLSVGGSLSVAQNANINGNLSVAGATITLNATTSGELGGAWQTTTALSPARTAGATVAVNGYMYIIGGWTSSATATVHYAKINSNGTLGSWTATTSLSAARYSLTAIASNGYIYALGGTNGSTYFTTVEYAKVNSNGTLGSWTSTTPIPEGRSDHGTVIAKGYIYVITGEDAGGTEDEVYYAKLNADGTVGPWKTTNTPGTVSNHPSIYANGYIYHIDGPNIPYTSVNDDGTLNAWGATNGLTSRIYSTTVAANGYLYVIGGEGSNGSATVSYSKMNADGTLGSWQNSVNSLPEAKQEQFTATANGYIYAMGGFNNPTGVLSNSYYVSTARLSLGGSLDLVGLSNSDLVNPGDFSSGSLGGQLTAGNTKVVGSLEVQGQANFAQNAGFGGNITVGGSIASSTTTTTNTNTLTVVDNSADVGWDNSIAMGLDGYARMAYHDQAAGDLEFVQCTNDSCSTNVKTTVDTATADIGEYTSIAIGYDGFARIAYHDLTGGDLEFVQCTNASCSTNAKFTVDSSVAVIGEHPIVAMASDGFARIAYSDDTNGDVEFAQCTNADCSTNVKTSIVTAGNMGDDLNMVLGSDGFARITYQDSDNGDLEYIQCTNAACTTNAQNTIDATGSVGDHSSIVLGTDGFARIAYNDSTNNMLKFARCANAACSTVTTTTLVRMVPATPARMTAIVMGKDGFARILFSNNDQAMSSNLWYLTCNNADCTSYNMVNVDAGNDDAGYGLSMVMYGDGIPRIAYYDFGVSLKFGKLGSDTGNPGYTGSDLGSLSNYFANGYIKNLQAGTIAIKPSADSTTVFQVQNASGGQLFNIDSVNNQITVNGDYSGEISAWSANPNNLPSSRYSAGSAVINGYMYVVGGSVANTVYYGKINADGSIGAFTATTVLPATYDKHMVVSSNGYIYVLGGTAGGSTTATVIYAKPNIDGTINSWNTTTSLPAAIQYSGGASANGYIYIVGGENSGGTSQSAVYYAKQNADGTLGVWTTSANSITANTPGTETLVAANGYLYLVGGYTSTGSTASSTVQYSSLNPLTGANGVWSATTSLPVARCSINAYVANGYIYAISGSTGSCPSANAVSTVIYAKLNSNGTVGSWVTSNNQLPSARHRMSSVMANGYLYGIGGADTSGSGQTTVFYASTSRILASGNLDLVGLNRGDISNFGNSDQGSIGGQLTAGNTKVVGSLEVQGQAVFAQNVAVGIDLSVGGSISQNFGGAYYSGGVDGTGSSGSGTGGDSALDIFISGRYMYAVKAGSATACSQTVSGIGCELQVYDITIPTSPVYVGGADASGTANGGTTSSNFQSIFVAGKYAYITKNASAGCSQTVGSAAGCELQVYDISNPSIPAYVGGADVSGSTNSGSSSATINDVFASGRYLYVVKGADATACSQTAGSAIGCEIQVYDISNPSSPAYVGGVDTTGTANSGTGSSAIVAVTGFGKYITVAKNGDATACSQTAGSAIGCEIQVYDISNPSSPAYVGGADSSGSTNSGTGGTQINTIFISGRYMYVGGGASAASCSQTAGSATGCELKAYSISNPTAPTYVGGADTSGSTNSGSTGTVAVNWVYGAGEFIYATRQGDATACSQTPGSGLGCELHVYNVSNPATPMYAAGVDASGSIGSGTGNSGFNIPFVTGRYLFVAKTGDATACSSSVGSALGCEMQVYDITGLEATSIATNTLQAGSLQVSEDGSVYGNFNVQGTLNVGQGASIQGELAVNGANFSIQHLSNNFGTAVEAGAFIDRNSVFTEEWNRDRTDLAADTAAGAPDWGDDTAWRVDESAATTGDCSWAIVDDTVNGIMRTQNDDASSICNAYTGDDGTANDPSLIFDADNLPVILMKVRPSNVGANDDLWVGLQDNSQLVANAEPNNGIFFGNTNGSTWTGTTRSASTSTNVTCTGQTINTGASQFALLKIEVISTSMVKFYVDNDVSNGVRWTYCGASTTNIPTAALASMIKWTSTTITRQLDTDFFRVWQDDNQAQSPEEEQQPEQNAVQSPSVNPQQVGIIDFSEASSSDIVFDDNVYIKGTLFVDKIVANKVIGMEVVTDQISSLQNQLQALLSSQQQQLYQNLNSQPGAPTANNLQGSVSINGDLSVSGNVLAGSLAVSGLALFTDVNITGTANFQNITVNGHIVTAGTQPNVEVLAAVDVGEESQLPPIITVEGNDTSGTITINTVGPQIILPGDLAKIEFSKQFGKKPKVFIEAGNLSAAQLRIHREAALTHFILSNIDQLQPGQIYQYDYFVVE